MVTDADKIALRDLVKRNSAAWGLREIAVLVERGEVPEFRGSPREKRAALAGPTKPERAYKIALDTLRNRKGDYVTVDQIALLCEVEGIGRTNARNALVALVEQGKAKEVVLTRHTQGGPPKGYSIAEGA